jgi:RES domain-containing protein
LLRIAVPSDLAIEAVAADELMADWRTETMASREIGDRWLDRSTTALLQVPSAIAQGHNFLLNPAHQDAARIVVAEIVAAPFDARLLK